MTSSQGFIKWENGRYEADIHFAGGPNNESVDGVSSDEVEATATGQTPGELAAALLAMVFWPRDGSKQLDVVIKSALDDGTTLLPELRIAILKVALRNAYHELYRTEIEKLRKLSKLYSQAQELLDQEQ